MLSSTGKARVVPVPTQVRGTEWYHYGVPRAPLDLLVASGADVLLVGVEGLHSPELSEAARDGVLDDLCRSPGRPCRGGRQGRRGIRGTALSRARTSRAPGGTGSTGIS